MTFIIAIIFLGPMGLLSSWSGFRFSYNGQIRKVETKVCKSSRVKNLWETKRWCWKRTCFLSTSPDVVQQPNLDTHQTTPATHHHFRNHHHHFPQPVSHPVGASNHPNFHHHHHHHNHHWGGAYHQLLHQIQPLSGFYAMPALEHRLLHFPSPHSSSHFFIQFFSYSPSSFLHHFHPTSSFVGGDPGLRLLFRDGIVWSWDKTASGAGEDQMRERSKTIHATIPTKSFNIQTRSNENNSDSCSFNAPSSRPRLPSNLIPDWSSNTARGGRPMDPILSDCLQCGGTWWSNWGRDNQS